MKLIRDDNNLFFFNDTATTEIYTLSLHDALPILIFAPGYDEDALEVLQQKKNIRILDNQERRDWPVSDHDIKRVDRKSTRLNSSHANISYAVFCLKKKKRTSSSPPIRR